MNNKIIEKIKKCLALSKSDNEHEAAAALRQAQALMEKHGLSVEDVALSDVNAKNAFLGGFRKPPKYMTDLAQVIIKAFGVEVVIFSFLGCELRFIGVGHQAEIAAYTYEVLLRQLKKHRSEHLKSLSKRLKKTTKTRRADLFAEAWCISVYSKVREFVRPEEHSRLITQYMENRKKKDRPTETYKPRKHKCHKRDTSSVIAGRNAAKNVTLNHGVNGTEQYKLARQ